MPCQMARAYYNEFDPGAAAWLRELIRNGHIAPGDVDERSIEDVTPNDLRGYTQCHFFAGIGVWSYALRRARWPDDRPVWTGSCPCQPFSTAGQRKGAADERHLWPAMHHLIRECRPDVWFGEQVASKDGLGWLDLVQADMEGTGYAGGAVDLCAAGVGAPHIRQRLWLVYEAMGDTERTGLEGHGGDQAAQRHGQGASRPIAASGDAGWMAHPQHLQFQGRVPECGSHNEAQGCGTAAEPSGHCAIGWPAPVNGFWRDADWVSCRDGKWRPAEPGTFPLAHGATARVGRLRGYGNAINAEAATEFIKAFLANNC